MLRRRCFALFACVLAALAASPAAWADPALWVARSASATVYLFGTIHVLPPGTGWETPKVRRAFDSAGELLLEVPDADNAESQMTLIQRYGLDPEHPLSSKLPQDDLARLDAALHLIGQDGGAASAEPLRPWLVGMMLSLAPIRAAGLDPSSGVDLVLKAQAAQAGKPVRGLETSEQQIRMFASMPPKDEVEFLQSAIDDATTGAAKLRALMTAWQNGDAETLGKLAADKDAKGADAQYKMLFIDRNIAWAKQLAARLRERGVIFVAVGAGHLAGPDSVQVQLAKLGVAVTRE